MEQLTILNSAKGRFEFPLGDKVFKFFFTMRSYEIIKERYNIGLLAIAGDFSKMVNVCVYSGLVGASSQNGLSENFSLVDFYDLVDELEPTEEQRIDIFKAFLDSMGLMARKSGKSEEEIKIAEAEGKRMRELFQDTSPIKTETANL